MAKLGEVLKQEIKGKGYTQADVAKALELHQGSVCKIYRKSDMGVKLLRKICKLFGLSFFDVIEKSDV